MGAFSCPSSAASSTASLSNVMMRSSQLSGPAMATILAKVSRNLFLFPDCTTFINPTTYSLLSQARYYPERALPARHLWRICYAQNHKWLSDLTTRKASDIC